MLSRKQIPGIVPNQQCDTYAWFSQRAWVEIDLEALSSQCQPTGAAFIAAYPVNGSSKS
ncbi:hypothetical protein NSTCB13_01397 [Nostoc sp. DSM 114160]|jgi:hypothetical protein